MVNCDCTLQGVVLGIVLFPIRVTLAALLFFIMGLIARLRLAGLSSEERLKPARGWRRWFPQHAVRLLSRGVFLALGFLRVKIKGRQAGVAEAPVLAVAPHSGFLDMLVLPCTNLATVVSRSENTSLPVIGGEVQGRLRVSGFPVSLPVRKGNGLRS